MELAKIKRVGLREAWKHEAIDFTNWLAKPENLELLSDELGIDITLIQVEASVGSFNVDILAEETNTGKKVVIENQLEATNHDHLGKIITYASGFDAGTIIWIVKSVRDEHKQAVDWLNEHTDQEINIFIIKMELWQIGDSPYAPKFQVIAKPNEWAKAVKKSAKSSELSNTKMLQFEFWSQFKEFVNDRNENIKLGKAAPQHWYDIRPGFSGTHVTLTVNSQSKQLACELYIDNSKVLFAKLLEYKEEIESTLSEKLQWNELPNKIASRIILAKDGDFSDKGNWDTFHEWMLHTATTFQNVFREYVKKVV